ncbi:MAG: hypothetical protein AAGI91_14995 [Bacteroidota bacterium]
MLTGCILVILAGCSVADVVPEEPLFQPGEYGGTALPGTEHLYQLTPSPDGTRIALVRRQTPGEEFSPRDQLWIVNADGSDPRFIGVNVGGIDWSPDGERLALTIWVGTSSYVYTLDLATLEAVRWSGTDDNFFTRHTTSAGSWFADGRRLLVSVWGQAYRQPYARGLYVLDTETGAVEGPLVDLMEAAYLGGNDSYATGAKYVYSDDPAFDLDGNWARYDFSTGVWNYITELPKDSVYSQGVVPSPVSNIVVLQREVQNADQLYLMQSDGSDVQRITQLGGNGPQWFADGSGFLFIRDVHRGEGAHWVPFAYDLATGQERVLWSALPDSVTTFPPLPPPGTPPTLR